MCPPAWKYARESAMATLRGEEDEYQSVNACVYTIRRKRNQRRVSRVRVCERYGHAGRPVYVCVRVSSQSSTARNGSVHEGEVRVCGRAPAAEGRVQRSIGARGEKDSNTQKERKGGRVEMVQVRGGVGGRE